MLAGYGITFKWNGCVNKIGVKKIIGGLINITSLNSLLCLWRFDGKIKKLLETILGVGIDKIEYPERQKAIDIAKEAKGIRLDVYVSGGDSVFCVEMQARNTHELPKRARYYSGLIDMNLIEKGVDYKNLNQSFVIFICTFDLFGESRHRYTFENLCQEDRELPLGDGTTKIFLNAKGTVDDVSPELKAFLDYVAGRKSDDSFVNEVDEEVKRVRENKEWRREYMTLLMRDRENIEQGEIKMALRLIRAGEITIEKGAEYLGITEAEVEKYLNEQQ